MVETPMERRFRELKKKHPAWTNEALRDVAWRQSEWERVKQEVLYECCCVRCRLPFGEHEFVNGKFQCPEVVKVPTEGLGALFG